MSNNTLYIILGSMFLAYLIAMLPPIGEKVGNKHSQVQVDSIDYKGHTMLIYQKGTSFSVCHSPECKKCLQMYD